MRRTLTVLVTAAALLVPATAASASTVEVKQNASCSSGAQRGPGTTFTYNQLGNTAVAVPACTGQGSDSPFPDSGATT